MNSTIIVGKSATSHDNYNLYKWKDKFFENDMKGGDSSGEPVEKPEFWFSSDWLDQGEAASSRWSGFHTHDKLSTLVKLIG